MREKNVWFQASTAKYMRTALLWVITQKVVVISYQHVGTTYRSRSRIGDGNDRLSQNVGKKLPLLAALSPKQVQFSRVENV